MTVRVFVTSSHSNTQIRPICPRLPHPSVNCPSLPLYVALILEGNSPLKALFSEQDI